MNCLVDSSALINFLRRHDTPGSRALTLRLRAGERPGITPEIYREVLQGARDGKHFGALRKQLILMPIIPPKDIPNSQTSAAWLYAALRWRGIAVRSSTDTLIAQIAIENDLVLIHDDEDFVRIAMVEPRLRLA